MRSLLPLAIAAFIAACGAPAYQPPTVRVAPSYSALGHGSAAPSRDSVVTASPTGVTQRTASSRTLSSQPGVESAQYSASVSAAPFWRELGDTTLARLIEEALRTSVDVDAAEARVTSARATRRVSSYDLGPTVTAIGSATRQRSSMAQVPSSAWTRSPNA